MHSECFSWQRWLPLRMLTIDVAKSGMFTCAWGGLGLDFWKVAHADGVECLDGIACEFHACGV
eukprot:3494632-Rhodomonas_salina.1